MQKDQPDKVGNSIGVTLGICRLRGRGCWRGQPQHDNDIWAKAGIGEGMKLENVRGRQFLIAERKLWESLVRGSLTCGGNGRMAHPSEKYMWKSYFNFGTNFASSEQIGVLLSLVTHMLSFLSQHFFLSLALKKLWSNLAGLYELQTIADNIFAFSLYFSLSSHFSLYFPRTSWFVPISVLW